MLWILLSSLVYAEPQYVTLEKNEPAPFAGKLLNDAAIIKLSVEDKFKVHQCEVQIDYELSKQKLEHDYQYQKSQIDLNAQINILNDKLKLREERIKGLEKNYSPVRVIAYAAAGFLVGAGSTIAIVYAVH
mgnify:CR=1 FL=1